MSYNLKIYGIVILVVWLTACGTSILSEENTIEPTNPIQASPTNNLPFASESPEELVALDTRKPAPTVTNTILSTSTISFPTPTEIMPILTATFVPTSTSILTATRNISAPFAGPLVAFGVEGSVDNYLLIFDIGSRSFRKIQNDFVKFPFHITWFDNGCHLYVEHILLDLKGNPVWHRPQLDWDNLRQEESWDVGTTWLSPNREWLAFSELSGAQTFFDAETVNIGVVQLQPSAMPVRLSYNGGARAAAWSTDGQWLAFIDYDNEDVLQVYRATPDGIASEQLTHHTEPGDTIPYLVWSPDDQKIAYSVINPGNDTGASTGWVGIISMNNTETLHIVPDDFTGVKSEILYWSQDSSRLMFLSQSYLNVSQVYWVNASNGAIVDSLNSKETSVDSFDYVFAAGSVDEIVIQNYDDYYLYDKNSRQILWLTSYAPEDFFLIREASGAPNSFSGETSCQ